MNLTSEGTDFTNESGRYYEINASLNTGPASKIGFILGRSEDGGEQLKVYYDVVAQDG